MAVDAVGRFAGIGSVDVDTLLARLTHPQHGRFTDAQVVEFFVLRAALCVDCVYY